MGVLAHFCDACSPEPRQVPDGYKVISEGKADILFPNTNEVFYNPVQNFNRYRSDCARLCVSFLFICI
jgi:hypothetical protein